MILLIDGYNVLKQAFSGQKNTMDRQRMVFIRQLAYYKRQKEATISEVVVVFDAGPLMHATREIKEGIVVMFSGQRSCADDWIEEYARKHRDKDLLLVSSDRKLAQACQQYGVKSMPANEFYAILQEVLMRGAQMKLTTLEPSASLHKYDPSDRVFDDDDQMGDSQAMDMLMEQASLHVPDKDGDACPAQPRRGNARALSKHEKKIVGTLKKLR